MGTVLVTIPVKDEHRPVLEAAAPGMTFRYANRLVQKASPEEIAEAEVILGNVPIPALSGAKNLRFLQLDSAGSTEYAREGVLAENVLLANATGAYGRTIAEHMVAVTFALLKNIPAYCKNMEGHLWKDEGKVPMVLGSKTLVIGAGDIGGEYAKRMAALGSRVTGLRRTAAAKPEYLERLVTIDRLDEVLPEADIVACALPGTPQTEGLMSRERILSMKKGSILLNVGRGSLIPADALLEGLAAGTPGAASIDVTEPEPLPADSPLWEAKNLLITPHVSGNYHTDDILNTVVEIAAGNLKAYLAGEPLKSEVDRQTGYRKTS